VTGRHINDQQVRLYMRLRTDHTQITAAAKSGLSLATGRRIRTRARHHRHCTVRDCTRPRARGDHDDQNTFTAAPGANQSAR
jgi:hypothetical protein